MRNAFIAAEDKRFFQHTGIDERGLVRAFIGNFTQPGRPQGGSTITQQVAKTCWWATTSLTKENCAK